MAFTTLRYETADETGCALATITLAREQRLNAIDRRMVAELTEAVDALEADAAVRVVIVTGAGRAFCAGADIKERAENAGDLAAQRTSVQISPLFRRLERLGQIVIAAVNGPAAGGGCELAMACDLRIASSEATFALPEVRLGILPGAGGTQRLPRLVGPARAKEMMLLGSFIPAEQALAWGLVNRVVAPGALMAEARSLAEALLKLPPLSLSGIKGAVNVAVEADLDTGLQYEQRVSHLLAMTEDRREGYQAFVEKREPRFEGR